MINIFSKIVDKMNNFTRQLESIKKNQIEILGLKTATDSKNSVGSFNSRLNTAKENINELKVRSVEKSRLNHID